MAILTRDEILRRLSAGEIEIQPYDREQVGPASVDLHLANSFRVFRRVRDIFHVTEDADYEAVSELVEVGDGDYFVLMPGETCHGVTRERIRLPDNLCGWLHGRSRFARLGLMVHITAPLVQPGVNNHQALEINAYHFQAASIMGQAYELQHNLVAALESFRRALRLNPNMEEIRTRVIQLQRTIKDQ